MRFNWDWLLRRSGWLVGFFSVITVFMVFGALKIREDSSAGAMNPEHNPIVELNDSLNRDYNSGRSEIFVLFAPDIFTPTHLEELKSITARLKEVPGVKKVTSLATVVKMVERDGSLETSPLVPEKPLEVKDMAGIKAYLKGNYMLQAGPLAYKDDGSTTVMVEFDDTVDLPSMAKALVKPVEESWTGTFRHTGLPSLEGYMLSSIRRDVPLLGGIAFLVILSVFLLNFRSPLGAWLPLLQIAIGLVWGAGIFGWAGMKFQAMTIIAPVAILAVGSSFTLHLLGRYFLEISRGVEKRKAIIRTMEHTGLGVFISGLAISVSMLTFQLSSLQMMRGLGAFCAFGVAAAMVSSLFLVPVLLHLLPAPKVRVALEDTGALSGFLSALGRWISRNPRRVLMGSGLLIALACFGVFRIVPNTSFIGFFKADSPPIQGMDAVDRIMGGSTSVKMVVNGDLKDPELLKAMLRFQEEARQIPKVGPSVSLASLMRTLHETLTGVKGLPETRDLVAQELLVYQSSSSVDDITSLANLDYTQAVITFVTPRLSTRETRSLLAVLEQKAGSIIRTRAKMQFAGDILSETAIEGVLLHDFVLSISLALILVIAIDSLVRNLRAALVTILVLIATIILQYGIYGYFGIPFTIASAMAGALAIGVGDYAIHLTVRYLEDRRAGMDPRGAIQSALITSGRSIVFTALTIGGGFTALLFSRMVPVSTLGGVMVLTVVIVGVATLTLLPAACLVFLNQPILQEKNNGVANENH